jgi:lipase maturation factor
MIDRRDGADDRPTGPGDEAPPEAWLRPRTEGYWLTRFAFLRLLGLVYSVAFLSLSRQLRPLLGAAGLLPVRDFLREVAGETGRGWPALRELPTIFWFGSSDAVMDLACNLGLVLSLALLFGLADAPLLFVLWAIYLSFVHVGQIFYSFGWEILLLETGFLAIFLVPPLEPWPFARRSPPPVLVIFLLRWLTFRVMFGAGLIKLRGDPCWRDLTCLDFHYETQPLPNPLSWLLYQMPHGWHRLEVLWNHLVELVVPFGLFGPRRVRTAAGLLTIAFQVTLILSGNLSFLNWLTLTIALSTLDDRTLAYVFPRALAERARSLVALSPSRARWIATGVLTGVVALLSIDPIANMLSREQVMNTSFDALHLVNTYGAFGSVGRVRDEVILQGTADTTLDEHTRWRSYEFPCKPGNVLRRPCVVAPYHYRLDWQIWFAAMSSLPRHPWVARLAQKLLEGDRGVKTLLANDPFPTRPPRHIRAELYEYHFTRWGERGWWKRRWIRSWMPPVSLDDPDFRDFLHRHGWTTRPR